MDQEQQKLQRNSSHLTLPKRIGRVAKVSVNYGTIQDILAAVMCSVEADCYFKSARVCTVKSSVLTKLVDYVIILFCHVGLIIENQSSFPLVYVNAGYNAGYPVEPVLNVFEKSEDNKVIPSKSAAALIWRLHKGGNFGM